MKRNLKIFLVSGFIFGIITGTVYSFRYGLRTGVIAGLITGIISGFIIFIIVGYLHSRFVNKIVHTHSGEALGVRHVRVFELHMPYKQLYDLCIESIDQIENSTIRDEDRYQGKIVATTSINWKTWGDTISFYITQIDNGNSSVRISSRPTARTTLVDYGKNLENVEKIISILQKNAGAIECNGNS